MEICLLAAGNFNVGDHALLQSWLSSLDQMLGTKDVVYVLGIEPSYMMQYVSRYHFRITATNALYRWFSGCPNEAAMCKKLETLFEVPPTDEFAYEAYQIQDIFAKVDLLHIIGGGTINYMWLDMQYLTMAAIELAARNGVKIVVTGQTIGPLNEQDEKRLMPYLNKVDFLDLRDDCLFLKKWGIKYQVTVDDIFAYMLVYHNKKVVLLSDVLQTLLEKKFTTVCLQSWAMDAQSQELYSYARKNIADFLNELLINDRQMHVYFLEFMHLDHDRERNEEVYRMLSDEAKSRCVFLSCSNFHPFDIALLAGKAQFCITTRLHLSIFSMMAKVPTYSIVLDNYYKMKLEGICAYFSSACTHDLRTCSTEDILKNYRSTQMVQLSSNVQELVRRKYIGVACVYLKATPKTSLVKRVRLHLLIHKLRRLSP